MNYEKELAIRFKAFRKHHKGLTLRVCAEKLKVSNPFLSQFENQKCGIGYNNAMALQDFMNSFESIKP